MLQSVLISWHFTSWDRFKLTLRCIKKDLFSSYPGTMLTELGAFWDAFSLQKCSAILLSTAMYFNLICLWPAGHTLRQQEIAGLAGKGSSCQCCSYRMGFTDCVSARSSLVFCWNTLHLLPRLFFKATSLIFNFTMKNRVLHNRFILVYHWINV